MDKRQFTFLIHPEYGKQRGMSRGEGEREKLEKVWREEVDQMANDNSKIMVIFSLRDRNQPMEQQVADDELVEYAKQKLDKRCVALYQHTRNIKRDMPAFIGELKQELISRGLVKDEVEIKDFSSRAFGEWATACVLAGASTAHGLLGLRKRTRILTRKSMDLFEPQNRPVRRDDKQRHPEDTRDKKRTLNQYVRNKVNEEKSYRDRLKVE